MSDTFGSLAAEITDWMRGDVDDAPGQRIVRTSINNSLESIWMSMMQVQLARFFGADSPVTFALAANTERVQLVSIPNPTVAQAAILNVAGGTLPLRTYMISYTYVTESGSETLLSPTASTLIPINTLAQVPAPAFTTNAFGWNCYASPDNVVGDMVLQNQQPLPFGPVFQEQVTGFQGYPTLQQTPPLVNSTADNISWIEHMEVRTSDTLLRAWNQHDIDSEVMRRMARTIASGSEYASYVWELTNGGTLEFRPMTGMAFNPRYWYVAKPRRIRYDQADLPYASIAGVHEFLLYKSIALCKLSVEEYLAHEAWENKADKSKMEITLALNQENWAKNTRVVPYLY